MGASSGPAPHPLFWTLGKRVRYVDRIHRSFSTDANLIAAVDGAGCWGGGDWRLLKGLPAALWPHGKPGCFRQGNGKIRTYGNRASEIVRLVRNLSQHFTSQRPELQRAILAVAHGGASAGETAGRALSVEAQEEAVGRCFFGAFPSLLVHLKHAEARAAQQAASV